MPRYFFDIANGELWPDTEGTELPDLDTATVQAIKLAGSLLTDNPEWLNRGDSLKIKVTDERGFAHFTVMAIGAFTTSDVSERESAAS